MSSTYSRICLSHDPPIAIDENDPTLANVTYDKPPAPSSHPKCKIGIGRYSGSLCEVWIPKPGNSKWVNGVHRKIDGEWVDVTWMSRNPDLVKAIMSDGLWP